VRHAGRASVATCYPCLCQAAGRTAPGRWAARSAPLARRSARGAPCLGLGSGCKGRSLPICPGLDAEFHLIPILQDVISPHHLTVEGTAAPHSGRFELPVKVLVNLPGKLLNGGPFLQGEG
jgi:hypothetical protein